jgi:hypothetical protein
MLLCRRRKEQLLLLMLLCLRLLLLLLGEEEGADDKLLSADIDSYKEQQSEKLVFYDGGQVRNDYEGSSTYEFAPQHYGPQQPRYAPQQQPSTL